MTKRLSAILTLGAAAGLLALMAFQAPPATASASSNWPQWRGPDGLGVSAEKNLPDEWSETKNIQWKTPIPGLGYSSPIVWDKKIFLTTAIEGAQIPTGPTAVKHTLPDGKEFKHPDWVGSDRLHTFKVFCLDRDTGKLLWESTAYEGPVYDHRHRRGTYAAPTPVTDGQHVYAYFGSEGMYCYDLNGKLVWKKSLGGIPTIGMGVGTSPVLHDNLVILLCDQGFEGKESFVTALDKKTGKEVWRVARPVQTSWATPLLVKTPQRAELITSGNEWIISYDPANGQELWRTKGLASHAIATPVTGHNLVIVSSGFPQKRVIAIRFGGSGNLDGTPYIAWKYEKGTAYVPSPILYGDYLYLQSDAGILTCLDVKTGEVKYEGGRVPVPAKFYGASPVAFDGKILLTSDDGDTFVIKAGPEHAVIRTNSLGEPVRASLAIADGKIFIRGEKNLYCVSDNGK
jgi:outer membrane protein assembly factor BamB